MNSANIFCTCLLKTWPLVKRDKRSGLPGEGNLKRSQLPLCEGSAIGRSLIGREYEWSDVGKPLLKVIIEIYLLVQRLK